MRLSRLAVRFLPKEYKYFGKFRQIHGKNVTKVLMPLVRKALKLRHGHLYVHTARPGDYAEIKRVAAAVQRQRPHARIRAYSTHFILEEQQFRNQKRRKTR